MAVRERTQQDGQQSIRRIHPDRVIVHTPRQSRILRFSCLGREVEIHCSSGPALEHLRMNFAEMAASAHRIPDVRYDVAGPGEAGYRIARDGAGLGVMPATLGELTYVLESDLMVRLQLARPDLLFIHAAALEYAGGVHLITGPSGSGKSTTCWGLLHNGFRYLSDEIAPIVVETGEVLAYPHALCMKREPPSSHAVQPRVRRTSRGLHVPITGERLAPAGRPLGLRSIFFVEYDAARRAPSIEPVVGAEVAARIYPNVLNALAHERHGLPATTAVASRTHAFLLRSADLAATCRLVEDRVRRITDAVRDET